ncbi:immunity 52 family protein [Melittangium boletus]|uniref:immunity 52 family protein n=1 Tax=Melittangium boletus TaxID=83453 RepID=UPI003DA27F29
MAESKSSTPPAAPEHAQSAEEHYLGVYWSSREDAAERCAQRVERLFQSLAACDRTLSTWYGKGWTREEALAKPLDMRGAGLQQVFDQQAKQAGRMQGEGFSLNLWNGEEREDSTSLSLLCGEASPWLTNSCVLKTPEKLLRVPTLAQVLRAMVRAFEPEWGLATSHAHRDLVSDSAEPGTFIGWLTYFSHRRGPLPALPPCVHLEPVDTLGTLLVLTPERFTITRPDHLALAQDVSSRLDKAGLLTPLHPESC